MLFEFGKWIDYSQSHPRVKKISPKKPRGLGHVIVFGVKPHSLNITEASSMASATPGVKNSPRNRCGVGHVSK